MILTCKKFRFIFISLAVLAIVTVGAHAEIAYAQDDDPKAVGGGPDDDPKAAGGGPDDDPKVAGGGVGSLVSPLKFNSLVEFFNAVLDIIIIIAVPIIVFFIIWAGFMYVTAGGDTSKIQKATTAFTWVVVGGLLILGAKVLVEVIEGTIDSFT